MKRLRDMFFDNSSSNEEEEGDDDAHGRRVQVPRARAAAAGRLPPRRRAPPRLLQRIQVVSRPRPDRGRRRPSGAEGGLDSREVLGSIGWSFSLRRRL